MLSLSDMLPFSSVVVTLLLCCTDLKNPWDFTALYTKRTGKPSVSSHNNPLPVFSFIIFSWRVFWTGGQQSTRVKLIMNSTWLQWLKWKGSVLPTEPISLSSQRGEIPGMNDSSSSSRVIDYTHPVYGHTTLNMPDRIWSWKLSMVGPG